MNKLVKTVPTSDLNETFLKALNGILQLTDRELELTKEFIDLDQNYVLLTGVNKNIANKENRKFLCNKLGITKDNLSRYIKKLKEFGILVAGPAEDELKVNQTLIPVTINDRVQITIILRLQDEDSKD